MSSYSVKHSVLTQTSDLKRAVQAPRWGNFIFEWE